MERFHSSTYATTCISFQLAKEYGSVYTLYLGSCPLWSYVDMRVKEAATDQGDKCRQHLPITEDTQKGYGIFQIKIQFDFLGKKKNLITNLMIVCSVPSN